MAHVLSAPPRASETLSRTCAGYPVAFVFEPLTISVLWLFRAPL